MGDDRHVGHRVVGDSPFASVGVLAAGGTTALAIGTGLLANARYLPMSFAIAPDTRGSAVRRAVSGALLADASFAIAHRGEGRFDIETLEWSSLLQYLSWQVGTIAGAFGARLLADPTALGLDALFPVFYLGLLLPELRGSGRRPLVAAALAACITLVLLPITPAGVPVLVAALAALIGLRRPA